MTDRGGRDERTPAEVLELLSREARESAEAPHAPKVDWSLVESKLFARVKAEIEKTKDDAPPPTRMRPIAPIAIAALAAAAAVAFFVGAKPEVTSFDSGVGSKTASTAEQAGTLRAREGAGDVTNAAKHRVLTVGGAIELGDALETHDARAVFERPKGAREVVWSLERESKVLVTHASGALVLALDHGAVEAQVAPVESGEAFAVDVGPTRVAVHGTHLRVNRDGERVVVDLTEGVVSIGAPPRVGTTYGDVITAPAHIEFVAGDVAATLTIDHARASVRAPVSFVVASAAVVPAPPPFAAAEAPPPLPLPAPASPTLALKTEGRVAAPPARAAADSSPPAAAPPVSTVDPNAEATIAQAVHACLAARPPGPEVTLTVSSVLELRVGDDGAVQLARFAPPLAPAVQSCAAGTIYKVRFPRAGAFSIPIAYLHR